MIPVDEQRKTFASKSGDLDERESTLEARVCRYAKSLGYWHRKFKSPGKWAAPDRIFKYPTGDAIFIEFKAKGKKATPLQLEEHRMMALVGLNVYVCDNYDDAKKILERHTHPL